MKEAVRHAGLIGSDCAILILVIKKKNNKCPGTDNEANTQPVFDSGLCLPKNVSIGYRYQRFGVQFGAEPWVLVRCNAVDKRDANMATKFPPTPFTTG